MIQVNRDIGKWRRALRDVCDLRNCNLGLHVRELDGVLSFQMCERPSRVFIDRQSLLIGGLPVKFAIFGSRPEKYLVPDVHIYGFGGLDEYLDTDGHHLLDNILLADNLKQ